MRTVYYTFLVLMTLTALALIWLFGSAVVVFLLSLAVAAAIRPMIESLIKHGMRKSLALVISFGMVLLVITGLFVIGSGPLATDFQKAGNDLQRGYERVKNLWLQSDNNLLINFADQLPTSREIYTSLTGKSFGTALRAVLGVAEGTFSILTSVLLVLVLSVYWTADQVRFERLWLSILPVEARTRARKIWQAVETGVGNYIRREASLSVISGMMLWLGYSMLGIDYPALLAMSGVFARLIPWLGPFLVIFIPLICGSVYGVWAALAAALYTFIILVVLDVTLSRRIFPKQHYSSLFQVIVLVALAQAYGLSGIILATILSIALQILIQKILQYPMIEIPETNSQSLANIKTKLALIKNNVDTLDGGNISEYSNLVTRLENLIYEAEVVKEN